MAAMGCQRLGGYIRLSIEERREAVAELTEGEGLSNREAAEVLGIGEATVRRDKERAPNGAREVSEQIALGVEGAPSGASVAHVARATGENEWYTPKEYIGVPRTDSRPAGPRCPPGMALEAP
jgi:hypothetical protein